MTIGTEDELVLLFIYPAWPRVDGALLVSKGGALPQTAWLHLHLMFCFSGLIAVFNSCLLIWALTLRATALGMWAMVPAHTSK